MPGLPLLCSGSKPQAARIRTPPQRVARLGHNIDHPIGDEHHLAHRLAIKGPLDRRQAQGRCFGAFGLGIAILALIPFNYLNARQEEARHEIQDAASYLEILLDGKQEGTGG